MNSLIGKNIYKVNQPDIYSGEEFFYTIFPDKFDVHKLKMDLKFHEAAAKMDPKNKETFHESIDFFGTICEERLFSELYFGINTRNDNKVNLMPLSLVVQFVVQTADNKIEILNIFNVQKTKLNAICLKKPVVIPRFDLHADNQLNVLLSLKGNNYYINWVHDDDTYNDYNVHNYNDYANIVATPFNPDINSEISIDHFRFSEGEIFFDGKIAINLNNEALINEINKALNPNDKNFKKAVFMPRNMDRYSEFINLEELKTVCYAKIQNTMNMEKDLLNEKINKLNSYMQQL